MCLWGSSVAAQTRVYVGGDLFADVTRFSRIIAPDTQVAARTFPPDSVEPGGGARVGAFFSPRWSLELGFDVGGTHTRTETVTLPGPQLPGIVIRPVSYESTATARFAATSVLIGYHPAPRGRIHPGFRGGVSIMHRRDTFTVANSGFSFGSDATLTVVVNGTPVPTFVTVEEYTTIANLLTATLGAEAALAISEHLAVTPELRLHAGGLAGVLLRPGVSVRWTF
jgi:hypothetical protein